MEEINAALHEIEAEEQTLSPEGHTLTKTYVRVNGLSPEEAYEQFRRVLGDMRLRTPNDGPRN